jgi:3-phosphoshikimate 1-carboxyvinyltransferase
MDRVVRPMAQAGAVLLGRAENRLLPLAIRGRRLDGFEYTIPEASAQVKTALILAAMKAHGVSRITQAAVTRDHSERLLNYLGVPLVVNGDTVEVAGPVGPQARELRVPGDPSSAAFFVVAGLLVPGSRVTIREVCLNPTRLGFVKVLERMGARITLRRTGEAAGEELGELIAESSELSATEVSAEEIPTLVDEVPILAVAASQARGETRFRGVQELRTKETDRLAALCRELGAMGADVRESGDDLCVRGPCALTGTRVTSHDDHRMVMSLAVAALAAKGQTEIASHACVKISFPNFFELFGQMTG